MQRIAAMMALMAVGLATTTGCNATFPAAASAAPPSDGDGMVALGIGGILGGGAGFLVAGTGQCADLGCNDDDVLTGSIVGLLGGLALAVLGAVQLDQEKHRAQAVEAGDYRYTPTPRPPAPRLAMRPAARTLDRTLRMQVDADRCHAAAVTYRQLAAVDPTAAVRARRSPRIATCLDQASTPDQP